MSDTPRTDAEVKYFNSHWSRWSIELIAMVGFARDLERELSEANSKLSKLSRIIEIAGQANDAASEMEVANSATFLEALAHTNTEMVEAERDQLKAEVERKRNAALELSKSADAWHDMAREQNNILKQVSEIVNGPPLEEIIARFNAMEGTK
jgi:hypothetical protein